MLIADGLVTAGPRKSQTVKPPLHIQTEMEFLELIEKIDSELIKDEVKITARPIMAGCKITERYNIQFRFPLPQRDPKPDIFDEVELNIRLNRWFENRYGKRLGVPFAIGRVAIPLRGDYYALNCPTIYGQVELVCEPKTFGQSRPHIGKVTCNILDLIENMTVHMAHSITGEEVIKLGAASVVGMGNFTVLNEVSDVPLVREALGDYDAAVMHLVESRKNAGLSKWASLQATEKLLKAFIQTKGQIYSETHSIKKLVKQAINLGLPTPLQGYVESVECGAGVRYGEIPVTKREAAIAHMVSLEMGEVAARCIGKHLGRKLTAVSEPTIDGEPMKQFLARHGIDAKKPTDLL